MATLPTRTAGSLTRSSPLPFLAPQWLFLAIFTAELFVKVAAYGFVWHKGAYLRDPWCQLDFIVVSLAWLPILFPEMVRRPAAPSPAGAHRAPMRPGGPRAHALPIAHVGL